MTAGRTVGEAEIVTIFQDNLSALVLEHNGAEPFSKASHTNRRFSKYDNWSTCSESNWERNVRNENGSSYQNNLGKGIDKTDGIVYGNYTGINP